MLLSFPEYRTDRAQKPSPDRADGSLWKKDPASERISVSDRAFLCPFVPDAASGMRPVHRYLQYAGGSSSLSVPDNRYHTAGRSLYQEEHRNGTACIPGLSDPVRDASASLAADLCSGSDQVVHGEENLHRGAYDQISVCDRTDPAICGNRTGYP